MGFEFIRRPEVTVRHWPRALGSNMNAKTWLVEPDPRVRDCRHRGSEVQLVEIAA